MKKDATQPSVTDLLQRVEGAFEQVGVDDWMSRMEVQPETIRTWRKRGEIPPRQLMKMSALTGKPLEWFTSALSPSFPDKKEKHVTLSVTDSRAVGWWEPEALLNVMTVVLEALDEKGLVLPPGKVVELVRLIYEHDAAQPAAPQSLRRTTDQFLRLVA